MDEDAATEIFAAIDRTDLTDSEIDQLITLLNSKRSKQQPETTSAEVIYIKSDIV